MNTESNAFDAASFRDPSGYIFRDGDGVLRRKINACYMPHYRQLMDGGLYKELVDAGLLVEHEDAGTDDAGETVITPRELPFISYPYEWSFSMLKDAALLTLQIQRRALAKNMSLKDATAYNVQFVGSKPIFIDTLSFEKYKQDTPWIAYGQYCRHFLAPLALMSRTDIRLIRLLTDFIDGIPLDLAKRLLPARTMFNLGLLAHIRLHANAVVKHQATAMDEADEKAQTAKLSKTRLERVLEHLESTVQKQTWKPEGTEWINYYQDNSYNDAMADVKAKWVQETLTKIKPKMAWDLGANTGLFSRIARDAGAYALAIDIDPACVERNYLDAVARKEDRVVPLCMDLSNPSTGLGWAHQERKSLTDRGPADAIMALALVHHLAIGNNIPFAMIAHWFQRFTQHAIVEFVPKDDVQTKRLLQSREDVFTEYTQEVFEREMGRYFETRDRREVPDSGRVLYWFEKKPLAESPLAG